MQAIPFLIIDVCNPEKGNNISSIQNPQISIPPIPEIRYSLRFLFQAMRTAEIEIYPYPIAVEKEARSSMNA